MSRLDYNAATDRMELDGEPLHCGQVLDVADQSGDWTIDRLEYDGMWYLVCAGCRGAGLIGVVARLHDT